MDMIFGRTESGIERRLRRAGATAALVMALIAVVFGPQMASAATRTVTLGTYKSGQKCYVKDGESVCAKRYDGYFTLAEVKGSHFTKYGPVVVYVGAYFNMEQATVIADGSGRFTYRSSNVEVCSTGVPVSAQAFDVATSTWSTIAWGFACTN